MKLKILAIFVLCSSGALAADEYRRAENLVQAVADYAKRKGSNDDNVKVLSTILETVGQLPALLNAGGTFGEPRFRSPVQMLREQFEKLDPAIRKNIFALYEVGNSHAEKEALEGLWARARKDHEYRDLLSFTERRYYSQLALLARLQVAQLLYRSSITGNRIALFFLEDILVDARKRDFFTWCAKRFGGTTVPVDMEADVLLLLAAGYRAQTGETEAAKKAALQLEQFLAKNDGFQTFREAKKNPTTLREGHALRFRKSSLEVSELEMAALASLLWASPAERKFATAWFQRIGVETREAWVASLSPRETGYRLVLEEHRLIPSPKSAELQTFRDGEKLPSELPLDGPIQGRVSFDTGNQSGIFVKYFFLRGAYLEAQPLAQYDRDLEKPNAPFVLRTLARSAKQIGVAYPESYDERSFRTHLGQREFTFRAKGMQNHVLSFSDRLYTSDEDLPAKTGYTEHLGGISDVEGVWLSSSPITDDAKEKWAERWLRDDAGWKKTHTIRIDFPSIPYRVPDWEKSLSILAWQERGGRIFLEVLRPKKDFGEVYEIPIAEIEKNQNVVDWELLQRKGHLRVSEGDVFSTAQKSLKMSDERFRFARNDKGWSWFHSYWLAGNYLPAGKYWIRYFFDYGKKPARLPQVIDSELLGTSHAIVGYELAPDDQGGHWKEAFVLTSDEMPMVDTSSGNQVQTSFRRGNGHIPAGFDLPDQYYFYRNGAVEVRSLPEKELKLSLPLPKTSQTFQALEEKVTAYRKTSAHAQPIVKLRKLHDGSVSLLHVAGRQDHYAAPHYIYQITPEHRLPIDPKALGYRFRTRRE